MDFMGVARMITKEYNIEDLKLNYFVAINQIKLTNKNFTLNQLFDLIENIQAPYKGSVLQFFNDKYVLNQDHIFTACYFVQKAFLHTINISKKKNLELFLYLSTKRQIKLGIESFGITEKELEKGELNYCIISPENNIDEINDILINNLGGIEVDFTLDVKTEEKYNRIKNFFEISDNQIIAILNSYGLKAGNKLMFDQEIDDLYTSLHDLICEKMALLSLEKFKVH